MCTGAQALEPRQNQPANNQQNSPCSICLISIKYLLLLLCLLLSLLSFFVAFLFSGWGGGGWGGGRAFPPRRTQGTPDHANLRPQQLGSLLQPPQPRLRPLATLAPAVWHRQTDRHPSKRNQTSCHVLFGVCCLFVNVCCLLFAACLFVCVCCLLFAACLLIVVCCLLLVC